MCQEAVYLVVVSEVVGRHSVTDPQLAQFFRSLGGGDSEPPYFGHYLYLVVVIIAARHWGSRFLWLGSLGDRCFSRQQ